MGRYLKPFLFQSILFSELILFSLDAFAAPGITYHGRLIKPDGSPVSATNVQFQMQIRTPGAEDCLMYEEIQTHDLSSSNGMFAISLNDGSGVRQDSNSWSLFDALSNRKAFNFNVADCSGPNAYTPSVTDNRKFRVYFNDGSFTGWEALPIQTINFIPMSIESYAVGGFPASALLRVEDAGTLGTPSALTTTQYNEILALVAGTSSQYEQNGELNGSALPTISSGESVRWTGSAWQAFTPLTSETDPNVEAFAKSSLPTCATGEVLKSDGTTLSCVTDAGGWSAVDATATVKGIVNVPTTGGLEVTSGAIGLPDVVTGGTYTKVTVDAKGRVTTGANITGSDITSGTIGGSTSISTTGSVSAASMSVRQIDLYDSDNTHHISFLTPATTDLTTNYDLVFPSTLGTSNQVLGMNNAGTALENKSITAGSGVTITHSAGGIEIEATGSGGTVTSVTGTSPISVATSTTTPVISLDDAGTAGTYGSSTEVPVFTTDAKGRVTSVTETTISGVSPVGSSLATGQVWVGDGSGDAQARFIGFSDLKTSIAGNANQIPTTCTASQTMTYSAVTDVFSCTSISITASQVSDLSTELSDYVEVAGDTMTGALNLPSNGLVVGTSQLVVSNSEVGIGTANPSQLFHVSKDQSATTTALVSNWDPGTAAAARLQIDGDMNNVYLEQYSFAHTNSGHTKSDGALLNASGNGGLSITASKANGQLRFYTGGSADSNQRMVISDAGEVGIGTTNPSTKLDVSGTIQIANGGETCSAAADGGMIRYNGGNLQFCNESSWQTLGVSGAGLTSLNGQTGSTQTFATPGTSGTAPNWSSGSDAHTLNIPMASGTGVTAGLLSKTDYDSFAAKQSSTLTDGSVLIGNSSNVATARALSGDATLSNTGVLTLKNTGTAGTYGSSTEVAVITTDAKGRVTSVTETAITGTSPVGSTLSSGEVWVGDGSNTAQERFLGVEDLKTSAGVAQIPTACTSSQTMTWSAVTDVFSCTSISITQSQVSDLDLSDYVEVSGDTMTGPLVMAPKGTAVGDGGSIALRELTANGTNTATLRAPDSLAADYSLTLPQDDGTSGQVLTTDGSGVLSWTSAGGSGDFKADGSVWMTGSLMGKENSTAADPAFEFMDGLNNGLYWDGSAVGLTLDVGGSPNTFELGGNASMLTGWQPTNYVSSGSPLNGVQMIVNNVTTDAGDAALTKWISDSQFAYMGAVSEASGDTPAIVIGQQTNSTGSYSERMRIDSSGNVGIGTTTPPSILSVEGVTALRETTAPTATANYGKLYVKSTDSKLYFMNDSGTETELGGGSVAGVTGTAPIVVDNTDTSAPVISISDTGTAGTYGSATQVPVFTTDAKGRVTAVTNTTITGTSPVGSALADGSVWIGDGSGVAAARSISGDISILNTGVATVDSIQGIPVSTTDPTTAQVLKFDGTDYEPSFIGLSDIRSTVNSANNLIPNNCTSSQTLVYSAVTDTFSCTTITYTETDPKMQTLTTAEVDQLENIGANTISSAQWGYLSGLSGAPVTSSTAFIQNGNSFGAAATLGTNDAYALNFETSGTTKMTILSGGNVGIGTTNPGVKLDVYDSSATFLNATVRNAGSGVATSANFQVTASGASSYLSQLASTYTTSGVMRASAGILQSQGSGGLNIAASHTSGSLRMFTGGGADANERVSILANGNVGIGTTNPGQKFVVETADQNWGLLHKTGTTEVGTWASSEAGQVGTRSNHRLDFITADGPPQMTVATDGNIGIGVTDPNDDIDLARDGSGASINLSSYADGSAPSIWGTRLRGSVATPAAVETGDWLFRLIGEGYDGSSYQTGATINFVVTENWGAGSGTALSFRTTQNSTNTLSEAMRIDHDGDVGIGTSNPSVKLEVVGEVRSVSSTGTIRLWGEDRPGSKRYGTIGIETGLCTNGSISYGLSYSAVSWEGAQSACPAGTWVCSAADRGTGTCNTARPDTAYDGVSADGSALDQPSNLHVGWLADVGIAPTTGLAAQESGTQINNTFTSNAYGVWCCSQ